MLTSPSTCATRRSRPSSARDRRPNRSRLCGKSRETTHSGTPLGASCLPGTWTRRGLEEAVLKEEEGSMASVRILLIDDHPVVRAGLRGVLEAESDFQVVGEADTGAHGISLARTFRPDVVVTDLLLPDLDGVAVTQRIRDQLPDTHVVILTSVSDQAEWVGRAIRAGAMSFVMKDADIAELVETVR